ncbi:SIS domain-containing protein [Actomonas aquatica]|uniref:SIS domain-containing protein n=1 Tax=Actomonas aquatica TaxID=2866162 RepID=A0ABZ1CDH8_9BACT|nr:SIS domain-containing protein [Opitutus sp. WL0086]WRQ89303.1 SIS domain-containing protein [Opitutus sp. WL0086]
MPPQTLTDSRSATAASSGPLPFFVTRYHEVMRQSFDSPAWYLVEPLAEALMQAWLSQRQVFLCGNGGSATNAAHMANDLMLGLTSTKRGGIRAHALSANPAVMTCLGNDVGYDNIFAHQLSTLSQPGDLLIAFSGSGNSPNIVKAITTAKQRGLDTWAILGFDGGATRELADHALHFAVNDMQIAEDLQTIVGHMVAQHLNQIAR